MVVSCGTTVDMAAKLSCTAMLNHPCRVIHVRCESFVSRRSQKVAAYELLERETHAQVQRVKTSPWIASATAVISGDGRTTCKQTRKRNTRPPLDHMVIRCCHGDAEADGQRPFNATPAINMANVSMMPFR